MNSYRTMSLLAALAGGGAVYFLVSWVLARRRLANMTATERVAIAFDETRRNRETADTWYQRVQQRLSQAGWSGSLAPILLGGGFFYAALVLVFELFGFPEWLGLVGGLPAVFGAAYLLALRHRQHQRRLFQHQLARALTMLASQIEAGHGSQRALEQIVGALDDPFRLEIERALKVAVITKDLPQALRDIETRYPSRAFTIFRAALEIDQQQGGSLAPAFRQAAAMLEKQFELEEEADAEIAQTKTEFYAIVGIIAFIGLTLVGSSDPTIRASYTTPVGMVALGLGTANFAVGIWRALRMFARAREGRG